MNLEIFAELTTRFRHVAIRTEMIDAVCAGLRMSDIDTLAWNVPSTDAYSIEDKINYWFTFNTINFCFWCPPRWSISYEGRVYDGSRALMVSLAKAVREGVPLFDPHYLANISDSDVASILAGRHTIPLFPERVTMLQEAGRQLIKHHQSNFASLVADTHGAHHLVNRIITVFPSFNDCAMLDGQCVPFFKRAQLLTAQVLTETAHPYRQREVSKLTVFADYRLPQALRGMGIVHYSADLAERIDRGDRIASGERAEIEIRASTVWASELLRRCLQRKGMHVSPLHIDSWLWRYAKKMEPHIPPHHKTITIFY